MKKYTVRIYNYYNNVLNEYFHNNFATAKKCGRRFARWWADIIESETGRLLYVIDKDGVEIDYNKTTIEPF